MIRVLVVDDDKLARQGIIALLPWASYQMDVIGDVQNGREALRFIQEHDTDLVFVDIDMPDMDGIEFMEKCSVQRPEIRFVILTFYEEFSYAQSAIRLGCLEYISKASLEFTDGDILLERIEKKYRERNRGMECSKNKDEKVWQNLKEQWNSLWWMFDTIFYEELMKATKECQPELRILERLMVKCIEKVDAKLECHETDIPWFKSSEEVLEWVEQMRREYSSYVSDKNEFGSMMKAARRIERTFTEPLHASEVAAEIGMSRSCFSMKFKKYTGVTFGDFVSKLRIGKAEELLLNTQLSLTEIAEKSGYEDVYYFSRVFREKMQCSPAEYRRIGGLR